MPGQISLDFWFDPTCPWTWATADWIREVSKLRPLKVNWHPFSLYFLNEGRELSPGYRKHIDQTIPGSRLMLAVADQCGQQALAPFYFEVAPLLHEKKMDLTAALKQTLRSQQLPENLLDLAQTGQYDSQLRQSTQAALDRVGDEVGVPILALADTAFFGPVLSRVPRGEEATKIFDAALSLASYPDFYELKRSRKGIDHPNFS